MQLMFSCVCACAHTWVRVESKVMIWWPGKKLSLAVDLTVINNEPLELCIVFFGVEICHKHTYM
jgi:hypothetical protein